MTFRVAGTILVATLIALGPATAHAQDGVGTCSVKSLKGSYAYKAIGALYSAVPPPGMQIPPGPVTLVQVGVITFDGSGGFTATGMNSFMGFILPTPPDQTGTYAVEENCTATLAFNDMFSDTVYVVLSNNGSRMFGLYTTLVAGGTKPGPAITVDFAKQ